MAMRSIDIEIVKWLWSHFSVNMLDQARNLGGAFAPPKSSKHFTEILAYAETFNDEIFVL